MVGTSSQLLFPGTSRRQGGVHLYNKRIAVMLLGCAPSPLDCHDSPLHEGGHSNIHDVVGEFLVI